MKKTTLFFALLLAAFSAVSGQVLEPQGNEFGTPSGNILRLPNFPGGKKGFAEALGKAIVYSDEARQKQFNALALADFIVEKDGSMSDIKIEKPIGYGLDAPVLKALGGLEKWEPAANLNGDPMRVRMQVPLTLTPPPLTQDDLAKMAGKTTEKPTSKAAQKPVKKASKKPSKN